MVKVLVIAVLLSMLFSALPAVAKIESCPAMSAITQNKNSGYFVSNNWQSQIAHPNNVIIKRFVIASLRPSSSPTNGSIQCIYQPASNSQRWITMQPKSAKQFSIFQYHCRDQALYSCWLNNNVGFQCVPISGLSIDCPFDSLDE